MTTPDEQVETVCECCHGEGILICLDGCHETNCPECDGTGWYPDEPEPDTDP